MALNGDRKVTGVHCSTIRYNQRAFKKLVKLKMKFRLP